MINNNRQNSDYPYICVMLLCYNYAEKLERCLKAICKQTFSDFYILFVDNGSTDNSKEVFESYMRLNPDIKYEYLYVGENKGPVNGWNVALKKVNATYIMFHDSDDWMEENCLAELAQKAKKTNADRVTGQYRDVLENGKVLKDRRFSLFCCDYPSFMLQGSIFKLEVFKREGIQIPVDRKFIGYDFWISNMFYLCPNIKQVAVRKTVYNYCLNSLSITQKMKKNTWEYNQDIDCIANIDYSSELLDRYNKHERKQIKENRIIWLLLYNTYATIANVMTRSTKDLTQKYSDRLIEHLREKIPNYSKCMHLYHIFFNGYPFKASLMVLTIHIINEHNLWSLFEYLPKIIKEKYIKEEV